MLSTAISIQAQVPNGGFENWTTFSGYETPSGIWTCFNSYSDGSFYPVTKSIDAHSGSYSVKIANSFPCNLPTEIFKLGALYTTSDGSVDLALDSTTLFKPSIPVVGHPIGVTGFYKFHQAGSFGNLDTMRIQINLYKDGQEVYWSEFRDITTKSDWTNFTLHFPPYNDLEVDSLGIVFNPNLPFRGVNSNSYMLIDDIQLVFGSVSVNEIEKTNKYISIKPNPAINQFGLQNLIGPADVSIFDISGKLLLSKVNLTNEYIDITALNNGIYLVRINTKGDIQTIKLIKE